MKNHLIISIIAAAILALFGFRSVTRETAQPVAAPSAAACTPDAIRQVRDAVERSVLSARCAKAAQPAQGAR